MNDIAAVNVVLPNSTLSYMNVIDRSGTWRHCNDEESRQQMLARGDSVSYAFTPPHQSNTYHNPINVANKTAQGEPAREQR